MVQGRGIVFRRYYQGIAKRAGKDFRDGVVVPFEWSWMVLGSSPFCSQGLLLCCSLFGCKENGPVVGDTGNAVHSLQYDAH